MGTTRTVVDLSAGTTAIIPLSAAEEAALASDMPQAFPSPPPATISRRQCAAELFAEGTITAEEAVAMVATATPPAVVEAILSRLDQPDQTFARLEFGASTYDRTNALVGAVMTALGKSAAETDDFFRAAAGR